MGDPYRVNEFENLKGGRSQTSKGQESDAQRRYGDILGHSYPFPLRHARMPVDVSYRITCNNGNQRTLINP